MKKFLIVTLSYCHIATFASSQCVEVDRFFTAGFHYLAGKKASGFQLEIGSTGSESNISYYAIVNGFKQNRSNKDSSTQFPEMVFGLKFAYRVIRVENVFNLYLTTAAGQDIVQGFYNASSIKLLTSLGKKFAISIEPSYLTRQKTFITQVGVNIILD
jgi:hypothetical protein